MYRYTARCRVGARHRPVAYPKLIVAGSAAGFRRYNAVIPVVGITRLGSRDGNGGLGTGNRIVRPRRTQAEYGWSRNRVDGKGGLRGAAAIGCEYRCIRAGINSYSAATRCRLRKLAGLKLGLRSKPFTVLVQLV